MSSYRRHANKCKIKLGNGDVGEMLATIEGKMQSKKYDHNQMVAICFIQHDLQYAYVGYERFKSVWKYLNVDVKFISRNTVATYIYNFYESETEKMKRQLVNLPRKISFTLDLLSVITHERYICLIAFYIDKNGNWTIRF